MQNRLKYHQHFSLALALLLSGCGGGGSSADLEETIKANDVINGYRISSATQYDELGAVTGREDYIYNDDTNTISRRTTTVFEPDFDNSALTATLTYDDNGNLVKRDTFIEGELFATSTFVFDSNHLMSSSRYEVYELGNAISSLVTTFSYNDDNQLVSQVEVDENASAEIGAEYIPSSTMFSYDANGNRLSRTSDDTIYFEGVLQDRRKSETQYTFNDAGQMVRRERTIDDGSAPSISMYSFDGNGNMFEVINSSEGFYSREVIEYEANSEPVYNFWLRLFKFYL